ncbi:N-acetyltransferase protein [Rhizobium phage RHEph15]|uniref:N-acetyltransferase protein n=1 Tax=Rhizobium phage RHph_TM34 TaxID=2509556 RepID=A0A7S5US70_9CAUD|nr:N-acetyltransferase protein [Rhizobium phage RHph_TM34]QXV74290.1 N-acetyltransferase protein [Rhizobium phage RHEph15]QXV74984.1 N-acetyltransferase protein [Rhizobium phage RHEph27]
MIRDISLYDVGPICELLVDLRNESPNYGFVEQDWEYVPPRLREMICLPGFVGVIDDDYKGFMFGSVEAHWYSSRVDAFEQLLYVGEPYRGTMLAPRLIKAFEQRCKAAGAHTIYAGATTGMNEERTIALYQRMGYRTTMPAVRKEL